MDRTQITTIVIISLLATVTVFTAGDTVVVTNPTPAASATMKLVGAVGGSYTWTVSGKVKPAYRGFGANVKLVCQQYVSLVGQPVPPLVFPSGGCGLDDFSCGPNVDACGNFSFNVVTTPTPQLDNSNFCYFVVHVDGNAVPNACNKSSVPDSFPADPNGTAPCSGGFCPEAP